MYDESLLIELIDYYNNVVDQAYKKAIINNQEDLDNLLRSLESVFITQANLNKLLLNIKSHQIPFITLPISEIAGKILNDIQQRK